MERIRELVREGAFVITLHADSELRSDRLTGEELRSILLSGHIVERQEEHGTAEVKFRIQGRTRYGVGAEVICKIAADRRVIGITVYRI